MVLDTGERIWFVKMQYYPTGTLIEEYTNSKREFNLICTTDSLALNPLSRNLWVVKGELEWVWRNRAWPQVEVCSLWWEFYPLPADGSLLTKERSLSPSSYIATNLITRAIPSTKPNCLPKALSSSTIT